MSGRSSKSISPKMMVRRSVELPVRRVRRVGRNQPCPCGSGRKYKDCHEAEGEAFLIKLAQQEDKRRRLEEQKAAGVSWYRRLITRVLS